MMFRCELLAPGNGLDAGGKRLCELFLDIDAGSWDEARDVFVHVLEKEHGTTIAAHDARIRCTPKT